MEEEKKEEVVETNETVELVETDEKVYGITEKELEKIEKVEGGE